jgi:hypothetical protein
MVRLICPLAPRMGSYDMTSSSPCLPRAGLPRRSGRAKAGPIPSPKITIQPANSTIPWITLRLPSPACYHSPWLLDSRPIGSKACPPWRAPRASIPTTGQIVCKLVTLRTPTDARIPFLFNHSLSLRLRRRPTRSRLSPLFPPPCGRFSSQRMGTPPSFTHSVLREDSHRALSAKGPHLSSSPILRLLFPEITRIPAISTGWRGSCRSRVTSHQLAPGRIAGSKVTAHQSMTYLISPVSSLVLVHSYFCFTKPFCTRSSIVPRPPSRLHFTFNQEVSL